MSKLDYTGKDIPYLKLSECEVGRVYLLNSRNLKFGAFDDRGEFVGIRHKFGNTFLDAEIHWDREGSWRGTARPVEATSFVVPDGILVAARLPDTLDDKTGKVVVYDKDSKVWRDTEGNAMEECYAIAVHNNALFDFLTDLVPKLLDEEGNPKE